MTEPTHEPMITVQHVFKSVSDATGTLDEEMGVGLLSGIYTLAAIIPSIGVSIRRLHDIGRTGWWILIALVPVIGGLWYLIECGFLPGTPGPNNYGADPLAPR